MYQYKGFTYTPAPKSAWDNLSMQEKSEMMKVAVRNGITDLPAIRQKYNEFAEGGDTKGSLPAFDGVPNVTVTGNRHPDSGSNLFQKGGKKTTQKSAPTTESQKAMQYFMDKGLSSHAAAGLVGNLMRESEMDSTSINPYSKAYGLAQWLGPRKKRLFQRYGNNPTFDPYKSIESQYPTLMGNTFTANHRGKLYEEGGDETSPDGNFRIKYVDSYRVNPKTGGVYDDEGEIKEGSVILPEVAVTAKPMSYSMDDYFRRTRDMLTESVDNTAVINPRMIGRHLNPHLEERGIKGAKAHAAWEKEHPNLTAWGQIAGAVPFAVAAYPLLATVGSGAVALGDAAAATTVGQGITNFLASNIAPVATSTIAGVPALAWADAGLTSAFGAHGIQQAVEDGGISPMTALEIAPLGRLAKPVYEGVVRPGVDATVASGRRFIFDIGDRYQGMKDAAAYRSANGTLDARTIANMKWWKNGGTTPGINRAGVSNYGDFRTYYLDNPKNPSEGHYFSPIIEKGGNMTLTTHLGGATPGDFSQEILPMSKSEKVALLRYINGVPEHTYFGEVGKTKNYAEQYFSDDPSIIKAIKDAARKKKEINEPYWNEQEHIDLFMNEENPIEREFQKHLYDANEPLSVDSYKTILQEAAKDNSRFALRYDSSPMGMFNPQGVYEEEFYNSLQSLTPKEQVDAINKWMKSYYPKARLAYLKNGEVMIPRPLLMYKGKK